MRKRRKGEPQVGKPTVVKEGLSLHQQIEERPSPGPEILAQQDRKSARSCPPEMRYVEGDSRTCNGGVPSNPPPYSPTTRILPNRDHPPQRIGVVGGVEGKLQGVHNWGNYTKLSVQLLAQWQQQQQNQ